MKNDSSIFPFRNTKPITIIELQLVELNLCAIELPIPIVKHSELISDHPVTSIIIVPFFEWNLRYEWVEFSDWKFIKFASFNLLVNYYLVKVRIFNSVIDFSRWRTQRFTFLSCFIYTSLNLNDNISVGFLGILTYLCPL